MQQAFCSRQNYEEVIETHYDVHFIIDGAHVFGYVDVEKCARHHLQGEPHHLGSDVDFLALGPGCAHGCGAVHHDRPVSLDSLAMKCRSSNAALSLVDLTIAGDQAVAQQDLHASLSTLLDEVLRLIDQDFSNELRLVNKDDVVVAKTVVGNASVGGHKMFEEADGIAGTKEAPSNVIRETEPEARRISIAIMLFDYPVVPGWWRKICGHRLRASVRMQTLCYYRYDADVYLFNRGIAINYHDTQGLSGGNLTIFIKDAPVECLAFLLESSFVCSFGTHVYVATSCTPQ